MILGVSKQSGSEDRAQHFDEKCRLFRKRSQQNPWPSARVFQDPKIFPLQLSECIPIYIIAFVESFQDFGDIVLQHRCLAGIGLTFEGLTRGLLQHLDQQFRRQNSFWSRLSSIAVRNACDNGAKEASKFVLKLREARRAQCWSIAAKKAAR